MATIISLLNQKGGVGKTTLAIHLAAALNRRGLRVMLVDADPQSSALDWSELRDDKEDFPVVGLPKTSIFTEVPKLAGNFDVVLIDGPPRTSGVTRAAIMASDLVLVPVQPSPYDVWSAKEIVDLLVEVQPFKASIKSAFVINRKIVNTAIGRDVTEALAEYELSVLRSHVCQRVSFAESASQGSTVLQTDPGGTAAREIEALTDEVMELMK